MDHALLLWPLIVLLFFWDSKKSMLVACAVGFFLDIYSPIFGIFFLTFLFTIWCGSILLRTIFSHRSFASFHALSAILILLFSISEYVLFVSFFTSPPLKFFFAVRVLTIFAQAIFLSLAYITMHQTGKRYGYSIETIREI
ncbi:hypothetical protein HY621_00105 [Candidatus Uhrbacteria bacterium]|nr:hypothetical protein [Candidatus Uhrbacteria bacterium]